MSLSVAWGPVFNSPLECGLRAAALLLSAYPRACDLYRLVQYDYLVVNSGDVEDGPSSIHPPAPHRSGGLHVRRSLVEQGLEFMARRMVVGRTFTAQGIAYVAGEYAVVFLDALRTEYSRRLRERAGWVIDRFQGLSDDDLREYMRSKWALWGAEFVRGSLLDGDET